MRLRVKVLDEGNCTGAIEGAEEACERVGKHRVCRLPDCVDSQPTGSLSRPGLTGAVHTEPPTLSDLDFSESLMESVVDPANMDTAWKNVKANRGAPAPGPDGITIAEFPDWIRPRWDTIRQPCLKKGSGTNCAQHPSGRSGNWYLTPFLNIEPPQAELIEAILKHCPEALWPVGGSVSTRAIRCSTGCARIGARIGRRLLWALIRCTLRSRRVSRTDLRQHQHVPGELLDFPATDRHAEAAGKLKAQTLFCLQQPATCPLTGLQSAGHLQQGPRIGLFKGGPARLSTIQFLDLRISSGTLSEIKFPISISRLLRKLSKNCRSNIVAVYLRY